MTGSRLFGPACLFGACLAIGLVWAATGLLRGSWFWDLRFVLFGCAVFLILTLAEQLASWFDRRS